MQREYFILMKHNLENNKSSYDGGVHLHGENLLSSWRHDGAFIIGIFDQVVAKRMAVVIFNKIVEHLLHVANLGSDGAFIAQWAIYCVMEHLFHIG